MSPFPPDDAVHLLSRLQFGVHPAELERAVRDGLDATLDRLLTPQPESESFRRTEQALRAAAYATSEIGPLKTWWHYRMLHSANPVVEKLTLHWHNHFATSYAKVKSVPRMAVQNDLFREQALGSFRELLHAVARDPAMLVWLDGNANRKRHPNENFAREVMELFSLGIGNYSEHDIQEAARAFSGWHLRDQAFWFNTTQHDPGDKTIFGRTGRYRGDDVLELCLDHPACSRFLAYKLLRTFVTSTPAAERIEEVAGWYARHHLATGPVLREVCHAPWFWEAETRRAMIKSPLDFVLGTLKPVAAEIHWPAVREVLAKLGQDVFEPPSVKGWDGGRQWIQSTGWIVRWNFLTELLEGSRFATLGPLAELPADLAQWETLWLGGRPTPEAHALLEQAWRDGTGDRRELLALLWALPDYQLM